MASNSSGVSGIAERYAAALFELADEQKALDEVADDLKRLREMLRESAELRRLVRSPVLSREDQGKAMGALAQAAGLGRLTQNFLGLVAKNRRLFALSGMIEAYLAQLAERRGEVTAEVVAAQPLDERQRARLDEQLRAAVGAKVAVDVRVDPSLLGGMIVKVGSRMVDASLKSKLHRLQIAMKGVS
ncbi:MAG: F0F1 ATP synthase subunit delta [Rhodospirillales bacterium]|nr:F0F1 ATP synthase subunit delta [Rhodospirillales bacterium]